MQTKKLWSFSCCWKDVRLKLLLLPVLCTITLFQLLLKGCTIEAISYVTNSERREFQLLLKGCTIEAFRVRLLKEKCGVSVVVERMYDWSDTLEPVISNHKSFSCCWKDVRLKRLIASSAGPIPQFQLLLKGCTIEAVLNRGFYVSRKMFQLLLKGCTIEAPKPTDWKQMIFDSWFLICFSKMVDLHKKCHYFRKFGVIAWLFLIVVAISSYILSTTKSP